MIYYNPLDKFYKSEVGAVCADKMITFRVKGYFNSVVFLLNKDGEKDSNHYPMIKCDDYFECSLQFSSGLYFYCFKIDDTDKYISLSNEFDGIITTTPNCFQLTVYDSDYKVPEWIYGGVIYQIFPDRFFIGDKSKDTCGRYVHEKLTDTPIYEPNEFGQVMNDDFFGGDLKGIKLKLPYLYKMGVSVIYLNPIFKAYSNHRYDTGDYMQIDPMLGTKEDLIDLINEANNFNIKIILDGVFNHTGDDSIYFNKYGNYKELGAYQSKESKYYDWYNFTDYPNKYESWWGIKTLPSVNETNESYIDFITGKNGVIDYYTKLGISGWRLDVVDELPTFFVEKIRRAAKCANQDVIIIGEVWEDASNKISYGVRRKYFQGKELDSVMNYPLKNAIIEYVRNKDVRNLSYVIKEQVDHYPNKVLHALMNILSTHDTYRLLTAVGGVSMDGKSKKEMENTYIGADDIKKAKFKLKVASLLQYTLPGVPSLYYGDEAGMQGYSDPLNRKFFPWGKEDTEITEWYEFLGKLRKEYSAFKNGEYCEICAKNGLFIYKRTDAVSEVLIATNVSEKEYSLNYEGRLKDLITNKVHDNNFLLRKNSFAILQNAK